MYSTICTAHQIILVILDDVNLYCCEKKIVISITHTTYMHMEKKSGYLKYQFVYIQTYTQRSMQNINEKNSAA